MCRASAAAYLGLHQPILLILWLDFLFQLQILDRLSEGYPHHTLSDDTLGALLAKMDQLAQVLTNRGEDAADTADVGCQSPAQGSPSAWDAQTVTEASLACRSLPSIDATASRPAEYEHPVNYSLLLDRICQLQRAQPGDSHSALPPRQKMVPELVSPGGSSSVDGDSLAGLSEVRLPVLFHWRCNDATLCPDVCWMPHILVMLLPGHMWSRQ